MKKIWKDIKGYEGHYQVSNFGKVKSIKFRKNRILKNLKHTNGYFIVFLCKDGIIKGQLVHRLIIEHFILNPDNKPWTNHKNGIKTDNRISNLEWVTASENQFHSYKNGLHKIHVGSGRGRVCKLNEKQVKEIRIQIKNGEKMKVLAKQFNVDDSTIGYIKRNKIWQHVLV